MTDRVIAMLVNEAAEALLLGIADADDLELAMTKGVNYPMGLIAWGTRIGLPSILATLESLHREYGDDRYRPSALLRRAVRAGVELDEAARA
jgi:3-hydroxybutyryl-CoA dehydrogenase